LRRGRGGFNLPVVSEAAPTRANWENRNFARPEGLHYLRHAEALARWPILDEAWARQIEAKRLGLDRPEPPAPPRWRRG